MDDNRINSARTLYEETEKLKSEHNQDDIVGQCEVAIMSQAPLLSQEQIEFLQWMEKQPEPLSLRQLAQSDAPGYTQERLIGLQERERLITPTVDFEISNFVGKYSINDRGRAVLLKLEQERRQAAEEKVRRDLDGQRTDTQNQIARNQNRLLAVQTIITLLSFVGGLLAEHFMGLTNWFLGLFG